MSASLPPELGSFKTVSDWLPTSWPSIINFAVYVPGGISTFIRPPSGSGRQPSLLSLTSDAYNGVVRRRTSFEFSLRRFHQTRLTPTFRVPRIVCTVLPVAARIFTDASLAGADFR